MNIFLADVAWLWALASCFLNFSHKFFSHIFFGFGRCVSSCTSLCYSWPLPPRLSAAALVAPTVGAASPLLGQLARQVRPPAARVL